MVEHSPSVLEAVGRPLSAPVLIQVPVVRGRAEWRGVGRVAGGGRVRRRRLRREVRMVASGLLLGGLLAAGLLVVGGVRPGSFRAEVSRVAGALGASLEAWSRGEAGAIEARPGVDPDSVELHAPITTPELVPVAFPGYLLPGDEREEARHAGS